MKKSNIIRLFTMVIIIGIIMFMPLREYIKVTAIFGIPFIFVLGFMLKKQRYSISWIVSVVLLLIITVGYGYTLNTLPERIEVKNILKEAMTLEGQGNYKAAIDEYKKLEKHGETKKMEDRIANAQLEIKGQEIIKEARQHISKGDKTSARKLLESVPPHTRTAKEAKKLLKEL